MLDTSYANTTGGLGGLDVYVWGYNGDYELHTGSRANVPTPKTARSVRSFAPAARLIKAPRSMLTLPSPSARRVTISPGRSWMWAALRAS